MSSQIIKEFTANPIITNNDVTTAVVNHLNSIVAIADNKKYEWEDAENPEEYYNITFDFDEWSKVNNEIQDIVANPVKETEDNKIQPLNVDWDKIKDIVDVFVINSTGIYKNQAFSFDNVCVESIDFNDVINYLKNLKTDNNVLLFYTAFFMRNSKNGIWSVRCRTFDK